MQQSLEKYDTIIIGGGLGGLSCGALLAQSGFKVAVLEKNHRLGGYATSYEVKGHRFDIAIQAIGGCDRGGAVGSLLEALNMRSTVRFLPCEPARVYYFDKSNVSWEQSGFLDKMKTSLCSRYPDYKKAIRACYDIFSGIMSELQKIAAPDTPMAAFGFTKSYPLLSRYGDYTVQQFLDELGLPEGLQMLITARSGYCMLKPEELSLIGFACTEMTYGNGAWMVEGGVKELVKAVEKSIIKNGGRIEKKIKVTRILTKKGRVKGIQTKEGKLFLSDHVVAAAAAGPALEEWLDNPALLPKRYRKKLAAMKPTGSYYIAYYAISRKGAEGLHPNMEIRYGNTGEADFRSSGVYYLMVPSMVDRSAAPLNSHCLCLSLPCAFGQQPGSEGRRELRHFLETKARERFPRLKGELEFLFELGPTHLAAMSGNPIGSAYGWAHLPEQSGIKRLNIKTPVPGLYLAGHWTMPGGGIPGVITSGQLCAQFILNDVCK